MCLCVWSLPESTNVDQFRLVSAIYQVIRDTQQMSSTFHVNYISFLSPPFPILRLISLITSLNPSCRQLRQTLAADINHYHLGFGWMESPWTRFIRWHHNISIYTHTHRAHVRSRFVWNKAKLSHWTVRMPIKHKKHSTRHYIAINLNLIIERNWSISIA